MPSLAERLCARNGGTATLTWPGDSLDLPDGGAQTITINVVLISRTSRETGAVETIAIMPATERSLNGATLTLNGVTYSFSVVKPGYGRKNVVAYQEATLV